MGTAPMQSPFNVFFFGTNSSSGCAAMQWKTLSLLLSIPVFPLPSLGEFQPKLNLDDCDICIPAIGMTSVISICKS